VPRLFVAVYPPADVADRLAALPRPAESGVRWVPPGQWHLTVRFLGGADVDEVSARLDAVAPTLPAASVTLGPRISRLGRDVVCVPAQGLDAIASGVAAATADLGDPPDPRPFRGHLTLARLRQRAACGLAGAAFDATFVARELWLVRSETRPEGAVHTPIASYALAG
jgi:2'-5' RNA ligase